jgi:hypothetical protein
MTGGILALDPSTKAIGWAYGDPGDRTPLWDHFSPRHDGETAKHHAGRIGARIEIFLKARIDVLKPRYIVFEQPYAGGKRTVIRGGKRMTEDIPVNFATLSPLLGIAWQIERLFTGARRRRAHRVCATAVGLHLELGAAAVGGTVGGLYAADVIGGDSSSVSR